MLSCSWCQYMVVAGGFLVPVPWQPGLPAVRDGVPLVGFGSYLFPGKPGLPAVRTGVPPGGLWQLMFSCLEGCGRCPWWTLTLAVGCVVFSVGWGSWCCSCLVSL